MNITCPGCSWSAEVPDEEIPAEGTKATCPKCQGVLEIKREFAQSGDFTFNQKRPVYNEPSIDISQLSRHQPVVVNYAGFWKRAIAAILDSIVLSLAGGVIGFIVGAIIGFILGAIGTQMEIIQSASGVAGFVIGIVLNWLYYTLLESSSKQATLGKMALGIIVTNLDGGRISFGKANARYWGKIVSAILLCIGFIMAAFTQKKQALHDIMASTLVGNKLN